MPDNSGWILCCKCGAKWNSDRLERKGTVACELCDEPGMVFLDEQGKETDETYPREGEK